MALFVREVTSVYSKYGVAPVSIFHNAPRGAVIRGLLAPQTWSRFGSRLRSGVASFPAQRLGVAVARVERKNTSFFGRATPMSNQCRTVISSSVPVLRSSLQIELVPCLSDNYAYLLHDPDSNFTAVVDPSEAGPVNKRLQKRGLALTHILCTHHHGDHTGGNLELKKKYHAQVVGAASDQNRIPGIDVPLVDRWQFGSQEVLVIDTPGHTRGHCSFYFPSSGVIFTGDTLFSLGCGRLFEGTPEEMWSSLTKLLALPDETLIYCGHEYTQSNAKFSLSVEPRNERLQKRAQEITNLRESGQPTIPTTLEEEKATNPFLRPHSLEIRKVLSIREDASDIDSFAAIRRAKDHF